MAETFFTIYTGTAGRVDIGYDYTQDVANNTTSLTVKAYLVKTNGAYASWNNFHNTFTLTVNGIATSLAYDFDFRNMTTGVRYLITTAVRSITHNADGTVGNIPVSVYYVSSTSGLGTVSGSGSIPIATIPRATTPTLSVSTQNVGGVITINTPRASTSFKHKIYADFFAGSWTLIADNVDTSFAWTIPTAYASRIPSATSGGGRIAVDTYNGSTFIGSKTVNFTMTIPNTSAYQPSLSGLTSSIAGSGADKTMGKYVQGVSKAYISFSSTANGGASISSNSINVKRQSDNGNNQTINGKTGTTGVLSLSGTYLITATTTDSRGRSKTATTTFTVDAYSVPKITSFTAVRNSTTRTTVNTSRSGTYSTIGGSNSLSVVIAKRPRGGSYTNLNTTSGASGTFSGSFASTGNAETTSYDFRLTVTDTLGNSAVAEVTVSTSTVAFCIKKDIGAGIGKIWEQGALDVGGDAYISGDANVGKVTGKFIPEYIPSNSNLNNYTTAGMYYCSSNAVATTVANTPVNQAFSLLVENHAGVKQTFTVYTSSDVSTWMRNYYSGTWGEWKRIAVSDDSIVGSGSNSNGRYVRFGDGTLICWAERTFSTTVALAWGSLFYHAVQSWTFPYAFAGAKPMCSANYIDAGAELIGMVPNSTLTNITFYGLRPTSVAASTSFTARLMAIGRWK